MRAKLSWLVASLLLVAALVVSPSAKADIINDYPYQNAPSDCDYGSACLVDRWNFYQRQCTSFVAWRLVNNNGFSAFTNNVRGPNGVFHLGGASTWGTQARAAGFEVNNTPTPGAVLWYPAGHVAWVENVDTAGSRVFIQQYNMGLTGQFSQGWVTSRGQQFIHFKDLSNGSPASAPAPAATDKGYSSQFVNESTGYVSLATGNTTTQWIDYKNTGTAPWYDSISAGAAGVMPVHLATSHPISRTSIFGASWGGDDNRPAVDFSAVFDADDNTSTSNQHVVQPGQIARFAFVLSAPASAKPGTYQEYFEPLQEGGTVMNDPGTYMYVVVAPPTYSSSFVTESGGYYTINPGSQGSAWFEYRNTGNEPWYDDVSAGGAGVMPVHLATSHPLSRTSAFGSTWGGDDNRAAVDFGAVYESDGTTLAPDQHVVWPNYVVKFNFTLSVPSNEPPGTYQEYFEPLQEGGSTMNDPGTYLYVNVP